VTGIEFLTEPERGYWERRGYSVTADPWAEDRYA
jgi:DMSO/TMAO reductase YedYZ molybdopterin-dependent catalytic subunit